MEIACIENGDLRSLRGYLESSLYTLQTNRVMKWGQMIETTDPFEHISVETIEDATVQFLLSLRIEECILDRGASGVDDKYGHGGV